MSEQDLPTAAAELVQTTQGAAIAPPQSDPTTLQQPQSTGLTKVREDVIAIKGLQGQANARALADQISTGSEQVRGREQQHAQMLRELFPDQESGTTMVDELSKAFERVRKAAGLPEGVTLEPYASSVVNAYVFTAFEQEKKQGTQHTHAKKAEHAYSQEQGEGAKVFLSLGMVPELARFIEQRAARVLGNELTALGLSSSAAQQAVKAVRHGGSLTQELTAAQQAAVATFQKQRHLTVDDLAAIMAHECQHLKQSNTLPDSATGRAAQSHHHEWDADGSGMLIHAKAGFNPRAWERVTDFLKLESAVPSHSHPSGVSRSRFIGQLIADPDRTLSGLATEMSPLTAAPDSSLAGTLARLITTSNDRTELIAKLLESHNHPALYDTMRGEAHAIELFERINGVIATPAAERLWSRFLVDVGVSREKGEVAIRDDIRRNITEIRAKQHEAQQLEATDPLSPRLALMRDRIGGIKGALRLHLADLKKHRRGEYLGIKDTDTVGKDQLTACVKDSAHRALWGSWREKGTAVIDPTKSAELDTINPSKSLGSPSLSQRLSASDCAAVAAYFSDPSARNAIDPQLRSIVDRARLFIEGQRRSLSLDGESPSMEQVKHGVLYSLIKNSTIKDFSPWAVPPLPEAVSVLDKKLGADSALAALPADDRELVTEFVSTGLSEGISDSVKQRLEQHPDKKTLAHHIIRLAVQHCVPSDLSKHENSLGHTPDARDTTVKFFDAVRESALYPERLEPGALDIEIQQLEARLGNRGNRIAREVQALAGLQQSRDLREINESNLIPSVATLLAQKHYSDLVSILKESLPQLAIPEALKAELRRGVVSELERASQIASSTTAIEPLDALARLYGVTITNGAVGATEAKILLEGLISDGIKAPEYLRLATGTAQPLLAPTHPLWGNSPELQKSLAVAIWKPGSPLTSNDVSNLATIFNCSPSELLPQLPLLDLIVSPSTYDSRSRGSVYGKPIPLTEAELRTYHANLVDMHVRAPQLLPLKPDSFLAPSLPDQETNIAVELLRLDVLPLDPAARQIVDSGNGRDLFSAGGHLLGVPLPSIKEIDRAHLPTRAGDWLRVAQWRTNGSDPREIDSMLSQVDRAPAGTTDARLLDPVSMLIYAKNAGFNGGEHSREAQRAIEHYRAHKDSLPSVDGAFILKAASPYMSLQSAKFAHSPNTFVDTNASFSRRIGRLEHELDSGGLRDHVLLRELSREICQLTGDRFTTTRTPITTSGNLHGLEALLDICMAETYTRPDIAKIKGCREADVLPLVDVVQPLLNSAADRATLARIVLEAFPSTTAEERFERIQRYLPEPSPLRDHYLKRLVAEYPVTLEQVERYRANLELDALMQGRQTAGAAASFQLLDMMARLDGEQRQQVAQWLCGITADAPWYLQAAAADHGVSIEEQPKLFAALTPEEKTSALRLLLLDESRDISIERESNSTSALFAAETVSDKSRLKQFVADFVAKAIDPSDPSYARIKETAELLFEHARPERRLHYFDALIQSYMRSVSTPESKAGHAEMIALFLEQTGPLGCKLMQMLSHDQNLPDDIRAAFSNRRAGVQPFSVFAVSSRVNDSSNGSAVRDITIERRLGTASIKQAHQVTVDGEQGVLKALRPTVEKYSEEDFTLCTIVTDHLRRSGVPLPRYLLDALQEVVREECSLTNEAALQRDFRHQVDGTASNGLKLSVPRVIEAHNAWSFEECATGTPLAKIKDPKEYERASLAAGLSLLSDITSGRMYHADLHDENIFLDAESGKLNMIDCGAIGHAKEATLEFLKAFRREDAGAIVDILHRNNVKGDLDDASAKAALKEKLERTVFNDPTASLEERANKLSYEVLDSVVPTQQIRYLIKALGVGGHHLEALKPAARDLLSPRTLAEKVAVGLKVWWKLR